MKRFKNIRVVMMLFLLLVSLIAAAATLKYSDDSQKFSNAPAVSVENRWYDDAEKKVALNTLETAEEMTLHLKMKKAPAPYARLILKTNNMQIKAYTEGKILYSVKAQTGTAYHIIGIEDVKKGGTIYLHLTPVSKMTGSVCNTVYVTTQNDFLFSLLAENKNDILLSLFLLVLLLALTAHTLLQIVRANRKYYKNAYACCCLFLLLVFTVTKSELSQFLIGGAQLREALCTSAYLLLPLPLVSYFSALLNQKTRGTALYLLLTAGYAALRMLLFVCFAVPMARFPLPSHLLLAAALLLILIHLIRFLQQKRTRFGAIAIA